MKTGTTKKVVVITGQTASGKSKLSMELCEVFGGEIISADSMQVYRGMDIGTAKPSREDRKLVEHHLIDILNISERFAAADFTVHASAAMDKIILNGRIPFITGGTGLYTDMLFSLDKAADDVPDIEFRERLYTEAEENGAESVYKRLVDIDPKSAESVHPNNLKRVIRYLELYQSTGQLPSELFRGREKKTGYEYINICLMCPDREYIYGRINSRVDKMINAGLVEEVRGLYEKGLENTPTAGYAIGYRQLFPYFKGETDLESCIEKIKQHTRNYAKRQETYFKKDNNSIKINILDSSIHEKATGIVTEFLQKGSPEHEG